MATERQKKLAHEIINNAQAQQPKNLGQMLESAGYGEGTQIGSTKRTIEQMGVQNELKRLGFDEASAKAVVAEILVASEDNNRLKAADMIFKVHGSYAPEKKDITTKGEQINLPADKIAEINEIALNDQ